MAKQFEESDWQLVRQQLAGRDAQYGLPLRRDKSVVFGSWNIRKFGSLADSSGQPSNSEGAYALIAEFCRRCDIVSIQEVLDSLQSIHRLVADLNAKFPEAPYRLVISDVTGRSPGEAGLGERMAFIYDTRRVRLGEVISDVSLDLGAIVGNVNAALRQVRENLIKEDEVGFATKVASWFEQLVPFSQKALDSFLQFIRAPYLATFHVIGEDAQYDLHCVNAHLWFGKPRQREREFFALLDWMLRTASDPSPDSSAHVMLLMGDLNLDFSTTNDKRRDAIEKVIVDINGQAGKQQARVNFPFLDTHPSQTVPFTTNARKKETFDHIAWFGRDDRFPRGRHNELAGTISPDDFDFGLFDFVSLFVDAGVVDTNPNGALDVSRFEFDLSDHMPIWLRLPLPAQDQHRFIVGDET